VRPQDNARSTSDDDTGDADEGIQNEHALHNSSAGAQDDETEDEHDSPPKQRPRAAVRRRCRRLARASLRTSIAAVKGLK
jgi:hypothetical protein